MDSQAGVEGCQSGVDLRCGQLRLSGHVIGAMALVAVTRRPRAEACFESKRSDESTPGVQTRTLTRRPALDRPDSAPNFRSRPLSPVHYIAARMADFGLHNGHRTQVMIRRGQVRPSRPWANGIYAKKKHGS